MRNGKGGARLLEPDQSGEHRTEGRGLMVDSAEHSVQSQWLMADGFALSSLFSHTEIVQTR
jgi:hypothetical protein